MRREELSHENQIHWNTQSTPANDGVDPQQLHGFNEGEEQHSVQIQALHQQPGKVRQNKDAKQVTAALHCS